VDIKNCTKDQDTLIEQSATILSTILSSVYTGRWSTHHNRTLLPSCYTDRVTLIEQSL